MIRPWRESTHGVLWSNGEVCCILGVCCPPESATVASAAQHAKLAEYLAKQPTPEAQAAWLLSTFDFAPHGSLHVFKSEIARHVRNASKV